MAPDVMAPEVIAPDVIAPDVIAPDVIAPDVIAPDVIAPDVIAPDVIAPDVIAPEVMALEVGAADGDAAEELELEPPAAGVLEPQALRARATVEMVATEATLPTFDRLPIFDKLPTLDKLPRRSTCSPSSILPALGRGRAASGNHPRRANTGRTLPVACSGRQAWRGSVTESCSNERTGRNSCCLTNC